MLFMICSTTSVWPLLAAIPKAVIPIRSLLYFYLVLYNNINMENDTKCIRKIRYNHIKQNDLYLSEGAERREGAQGIERRKGD